MPSGKTRAIIRSPTLGETVKRISLSIVAVLVASALPAHAECYGSGGYSVCSDSYTDSNGDVHAYSYDSDGHHYSVDSDSYSVGDDNYVSTHDSDGNSYSIHSWVDPSGAAHTTDSDGHECSVYPDGTTIGC